MSGLTGISLRKIHTLWSSIPIGVGFLLQFIIINNKVMSEYICIEIKLTFI